MYAVLIYTHIPVYVCALSTLNFAFEEPENALSVPTWAIHFSSVFEWIFAMKLVWDYSEVSVHTLLMLLLLLYSCEVCVHTLLMLLLLLYSCFTL